MIKHKKKVIFFFLTYVLFGSYLSIYNGISHDQYHEQLNWQINFEVIKGVFLNLDNYQVLKNYIDRYHGIAFHYLSQPFQFTLSGLVSEINQSTEIGSIYISRHLPNFIIFSVSGIYFFYICMQISNNFKYSITCSAMYLVYPYLFGHAQINAKDIPFLSFWIIATYYLFLFIDKLANHKSLMLKDALILSFITSYLISIRISGSLILLEYLIALVIFLNFKKTSIIIFLKKNNFFLICFIIFTLFFIYLLNPILWFDPLEISNSFKWMSKYYHDTCTLTLGNCMKAKNLPSSYIFIWLFFKLPIIVLFGFFTFPLVEKKIFNNKLNSVFYLTALITTISIILILILRNVSLYDEIRHVMFLIPLIFFTAFYNIYLLNRKLFYVLSCFTIIFFIIENIALKKYQYTWLNSFAKLTDIQKNFEIDYWGISNKNLQNAISIYSNKNDISKATCVYGDLYSEVFLQKKGFTCFGSYSEIDALKKKPFFAYQNVRNLKRSRPKDCNLLYTEKYNYNFYNRDIITGKVWYCN